MVFVDMNVSRPFELIRKGRLLTASIVFLSAICALSAVASTSVSAQETPAPPSPPAVEVDPIVALIRQKLAGTTRGGNVDRDRQALAEYYGERSGPPVWVAGGGFTPRGRTVIAEIAKADTWGLSAGAFDLPREPGAGASPEALANAEIKVALAILKYARHARGGRGDPSQVSRNIDYKLDLVDPKTVISAIVAADAPDAYLRSLHPKHVQFERLRQALLKLRAAHSKTEASVEVANVRLPDGPDLQPGQQHPHIALLRRRLGVSAQPRQETVYDQRLEQAVRAFQHEHGLAANGTVTARTRAALNEVPKQESGTEMQRILINMERWRWMPETLGDLYVWDNVPEYLTRVVKKGKLIHSAKLVVGKPTTQTPLFSANMKYIVFQPEWGVPESIKIKEILPYLRPTSDFFDFGESDTRILRRHNLRVSYNGHPVDPRRIDWSQVDVRRFDFIQPAGPSNVLGVVKFRFPNKHDVYMHDTPQKELFERTMRALSHGCMRVQDPRHFAELILSEDKGWSAAQVDNLIATSYNNEVEISRPFPVHVTYFTAVADEDGTVKYFDDIYGYDSRMAMALTGKRLPGGVEVDPSLEEGIREARRPRSPYRGPTGPADFFSGLFAN
jgi:L,D-transpeptidase YcbB